MKTVLWIGSAREDLRSFPPRVQDIVGFALFQAQCGRKHVDARPLRGFHGAAVLEVVADYGGDTYRVVYTVRLRSVICVLHAFKKKSRRGIETPERDMNLIRERLRRAVEHHAKASGEDERR